ncbi:MAG: hypothetical protein LBS19_02350 [Clostridiales bacterium]|jgi:hypothetical protein|nr:hypothetical protein [Clostridiales bacterium]
MNLNYTPLTASTAHIKLAEEDAQVLAHDGLTAEQKQLHKDLSHMRTRDADIDLMLEAFRNSGYDFDAIASDKGVPPVDPRTLRQYCPVFRLDDTTPEGLTKKDAAERFMLEYATGTPEERKPHLDRIFNEMEKGMPLPSGDLWGEANARVRDEESFLFDNKFCYLENVIKDNPAYVAERFNTPKKLERLDASMTYNPAFFGMYNVYLHSNNIKPNGHVGEPDSGVAEDMAMKIPEAITKAEVASQTFMNKLAMLDGKALPNPSIDFNFNKDPSGYVKDSEIFKLKEQFRRGTVSATAPGVLAAQTHFDAKMDSIFDSTQTNRLRARQLDKLDMIFINGVSAKELYQDKYINMPNDRDALIKAEIISSMVNDGAKIDVTPIMIDKNGNEKVTPISLRPSVKEIQPSLNPFKRMINGLCSPFGKPFKTENDKLAIAGDTPDPEKSARLAAAVGKIQEKVTIAEEKALAEKRIEQLKTQPSAFLKISRQFAKEQDNDRLQLCHALFGEEFDHTHELGNSQHVQAGRGGVNIGAAMLFVKGYSFEQIFDPEQLKDEKRAAGNQIKELIAMGNSGDPARENAEKESIAGIYEQFIIKNNKLPVMDIDHNEPARLAGCQRELRGRGDVAFDIAQEIANVKDVIIARNDERSYHNMVGKAAESSYLYRVLEESVGAAARAVDAPKIGQMRDHLLQSAMGIHMRGEIAGLFNTGKGETIGSIDCKPTVSRCSDFYQRFAQTGILYSKNGDFQKTVMNVCHDRDITVTDNAITQVKADFSKGVSLRQPEPEQERVSMDWGAINGQPVMANDGREPISRQVEMGGRQAG